MPAARLSPQTGVWKRIGQYLADVKGASVLIALIFLGGVLLFWGGFGPGDEGHYVGAAYHWLEDGPFLGKTHWELRHLLVLPIAASFAVLGPGEFAATLPNILYAGGLIAVTWYFGRRYLGHYEAMTAAALMALSPFFVARPIGLAVYGAEVFYTALAAWFFIAAQIEQRKFAYLFAAGLSAGLAWSLREVSVSAVIGFGVLTLIFHRQRFFSAAAALGLGFGSVIAFELIIYGLAAGDPLYRYKLDLAHTGASISTEYNGPPPTFWDRLLLPFKDILTYPMMTPFVFLALIGAYVFRAELVRRPSIRRRVLFNFAVLAAFALPVSAWILHLAMPNYYPIVGYAAYLVIGAACVACARLYGAAAGVLAGVLVFGMNLIAEDFRNYDDYAEPKFLAAHVGDYHETIYTDYITALRVRMLLQLKGWSVEEAARRVQGVAKPAPGALYFQAYPKKPMPKPGAAWCLLESADVRAPSWTHALLRTAGAQAFAPKKVREVIARPAPAELYRVTQTPAHADPVLGVPCRQARADRGAH